MPETEPVMYLPTGPLQDRIEHAQRHYDKARFALHHALMVNLSRVVRDFFPTAEIITLGEEDRWEPPYGMTLTSVRDGEGAVLWDVGESRHHQRVTVDGYTWRDVARYIGPHASTGVGAEDPGSYWPVFDPDEDITQYEVILVNRGTVTAWTTRPATPRARPSRLRSCLRFLGLRPR